MEAEFQHRPFLYKRRLELLAAQAKDSLVQHNTRQGLMVIAICFIPVFLIAIFLTRGHVKQDVAAFQQAVRAQMATCYGWALTNGFAGPKGEPGSLTAGQLRRVFYGEDTGSPTLRGVAGSNDVWVSAGLVHLMTTNLLCVARVSSDRFCGIDGNGRIMEVPNELFGKWTHIPAEPSEKEIHQK